MKGYLLGVGVGRKPKSIPVIIILFFLLWGFSGDFAIHAAGAVRVMSEQQQLKPGEEFQADISVKNNTGLLGFIFTLNYHENDVVIDSIQKGELISDGIFDDNLGDNAGSVKVLWAGLEECKKDGCIFSVKGHLGEKAGKEVSIQIVPSPDDIFNAEYVNVNVECSPILLRGGSKPEATEKKQEDEQGESEAKAEVNAEDEFIRDIETYLEENQIKNTIEDTMRTYGVRDWSSVENSDREKAANEIIRKLKDLLSKVQDKKGADSQKDDDYSIEKSTADIQLNTIEKLYTEMDRTQETKNDFMKWRMMVLILGVILVMGTGMYIWEKNKQKNESEGG